MSDIIFWWKSIGFAVSVIAVALIIFIVIKTQALLKWRNLKELGEFLTIQKPPEKVLPERWIRIQKMLDSENPSDWRLAVIEADSIMDDLLKLMGYKGESMGERLQKIEPSDFESLNAVWEAHKIRNLIAHQADYPLSKNQARRVVALFEQALREFDYL